MKYKSFQEYLLAQNLTDKLSEEERISLQAQWRKVYQRAYHAQYGQRRIRKTITLTDREAAMIQKAAQRHALKDSAFIKQAVFAYLDQTYIVPDQDEVHQLVLQLRRIGTNVNQIARHINSRQKVEEGQIDVLYTLLQRVEQHVIQKLTEPDLLEMSIEKAIETDPAYPQKLERIIANHKTKRHGV